MDLLVEKKSGQEERTSLMSKTVKDESKSFQIFIKDLKGQV